MVIKGVQIENILCPTDFSTFSSRALRHAMALARRYESRLTLLHVIPFELELPPAAFIPYLYPLVATRPEEQAEAAEQLRRFAEPALQAGISTRMEVRRGDPWRQIQTLSEELPAQLVVMGTHGSGGLERFVLGSVSEKVLRRAPCPVLTVCHEEGRTWQLPGLWTRILCATDLREGSKGTLTYALSLAGEQEAKITLLHVIEPRLVESEFPFYALPEQDPRRDELELDAWEQLHKALPDSIRTSCDVEERVSRGRAHKEILRLAVEQRADLIVLGTQGHGPIGRALLGSTSDDVVRGATCPVLTVRPLRVSKSPTMATGLTPRSEVSK